MVHALEFFGGVPQTVLTDNTKTVVLDRINGQPCLRPKMLDFAAHYGFVPPRVCHPYRPQTKGKIKSTIRFIKSSFWPGTQFTTLADLNRQALVWCSETNRRVHATTPGITAGALWARRTHLASRPASLRYRPRELSPGDEGLPGQLSRQPLLGAPCPRRAHCHGA